MLHRRDKLLYPAALIGFLGAAAMFNASAARLDSSERSALRSERELTEILAEMASSPPAAGPATGLRTAPREAAPGFARAETSPSVGATSSLLEGIGRGAPRTTVALQLERDVDAREHPVLERAESARSYERLAKLHKVSVAVARGDSLYRIVQRHGFRRTDLVERLASAEHAKLLSRLRPARVLDFHVDAHKSIQGLVYHLDETQSLHVERTQEGYRSRVMEEQLERRAVTAAATVTSSVIAAGRKVGLPNKVLAQVVAILGWDVDFAKDVQPGDRFALVYEELIKDGRRVKAGDILAIEFVNKSRAIRAVRYTDENGQTDYYSPDGRSMRGAFLRTPVQFSRISSRFGARRKHPILHTVRAHHGIDYAAPAGTPIRAAGDGKVIFKGNKGGYGKTMVIQHRATHTTLYAHMSRFARVAHGERVKQGQTIGYVGQSGLATGPHLHYELRVGGVHKDPAKRRTEKAESVAKLYHHDFLEKTADLIARLDLLSPAQLALNGT